MPRYKGQYMTRVCLCCANAGRPCRVEEDEQCPVALKITVGSANPDLTQEQQEKAFAALPEWMRAVLAMPNPQIVLCAHCAGEVFSAQPKLVDDVLAHVDEGTKRVLFPERFAEPEPEPDAAA